MSALTQSTLLGAKVVVSKAAVAKRTNVVTRAGQYDDELLQTAVRPSFFLCAQSKRNFCRSIRSRSIFGRKARKKRERGYFCDGFECIRCGCDGMWRRLRGFPFDARPRARSGEIRFSPSRMGISIRLVLPFFLDRRRKGRPQKYFFLSFFLSFFRRIVDVFYSQNDSVFFFFFFFFVSFLSQQQQNMTKPGKGILAMDESNATCVFVFELAGVENTEENRRRYRELLSRP